MKKVILLLALVALTGCSSRNKHGECIGLSDKENPALDYKYDAWNIAMGVVFVEMIIPPIVVALDELKCPTGPKTETK